MHTHKYIYIYIYVLMYRHLHIYVLWSLQSSSPAARPTPPPRPKPSSESRLRPYRESIGTVQNICNLLRALINIRFLLVPYGYIIINIKRIPQEMTDIGFWLVKVGPGVALLG